MLITFLCEYDIKMAQLCWERLFHRIYAMLVINTHVFGFVFNVHMRNARDFVVVCLMFSERHPIV